MGTAPDRGDGIMLGNAARMGRKTLIARTFRGDGNGTGDEAYRTARRSGFTVQYNHKTLPVIGMPEAFSIYNQTHGINIFIEVNCQTGNVQNPTFSVSR